MLVAYAQRLPILVAKILATKFSFIPDCLLAMTDFLIHELQQLPQQNTWSCWSSQTSEFGKTVLFHTKIHSPMKVFRAIYFNDMENIETFQ